MSATLARERCRHHPERTAAGRCPVCQSFYCRECITEHEGRLLCAACVRKTVVETLTAPRVSQWTSIAMLVLAFAVAWVFWALGEGLLWELLRK